MAGGKLIPPTTDNYLLLQTRRGGRAGQRLTVKRATLEQHGNHILRTDRLDRALDLVDVLTEIPVEVAVVVAEVSPLQFTHRELRGKAEGSLTDIVFGDETLERLASDDEAHLVRSGHPSRIAALSKPVRDGGADDGVDKDEVAGAIEASSAEGLLVDTEGETTIALELITADALLAQLEAASGEIQEVFLDIGIVADVFDGIGSKKNLEELAILGGERLRKHLLAKEGSNAIEGLEVEGAVRKNLRELRVDLLHIAREVLGERTGGIDNILNARLDQELIANISVDDLEDGLLKRNLRLEIGTLEGGTSLLDADARASTTKGLKAELILGRANLVSRSTNTAEGEVGDEVRSGERSSRNGHFLDNATDGVGNAGERAAINRVDVGGLTGQNFSDLTDDAVDILAGEVLDRGQRDAVIGICHFVVLVDLK